MRGEGVLGSAESETRAERVLHFRVTCLNQLLSTLDHLSELTLARQSLWTGCLQADLLYWKDYLAYGVRALALEIGG